MNNSPPICSVCISNYNGESIIAECLESVANQICDFPFEIIVHDDASTDRSLTILETDYPRVRVIESKENVGFCISNNRMAKQAKGNFILLLNNDATLAPDALATLYRYTLTRSSPCILTLPQYDWATGVLVDRGCLLDYFYNPIPNLDSDRQEVAMVIGACLWIPRPLWIELDGFPEWFESIAEDMQICCRARLAGASIIATRESGYRHRQGISFGGNRSVNGLLKTTYLRRQLSERNKTFVMMLCTPAPYLWIILPIHLLMLTIEGIILSTIKFDLSILKNIYLNAIFSIISNQKKIFNARKKTLSQQTISAHCYYQQFKALPRKLTLLIRYGIPSIDKRR